MAVEDHQEAAPRKGRGNAILTYEKVEEIVLGLQKVDLKLDNLEDKLDDVGKKHDDHEVRIRALELAFAGNSQTSSFAKWIWQAAWPAAATIISLLGYFKH